MTSDGFCFNFNLIDYFDIFNDEKLSTKDFESFKNNLSSSYDAFDGYRTQDTDSYPFRIFSGEANSLAFIFVHYKNDEDSACSGADMGFKVYWHQPYEIPLPWHRSIFVRPSNEYALFMKATRVTTSKYLERYR
jgi:hypothetical protein